MNITKNCNLNYSKYNNKPAFGRGVDPLTDEFSQMSEEEKAQKLKSMVREIEESNKGPSAARTFAIVSMLTAASALTASAVSGRFFNVLNQLGAFKKVMIYFYKGLEKLGLKLENTEVPYNFKGKIVKGARKVVSGLKENSVYGIEYKLANVKTQKAEKLAEITREVTEKFPEIANDKVALDKAVKEAIENNPLYKESIKELDKLPYDLKGSNLCRKATKATAATIGGYGALKEASRDEDNNGIPDCVEYANSRKEATKKMTAALIDCAIDSVS